MEPTDENIRAYEAAHRARPDPVELPPIVQRTLGDLKKKRVLHLHCGTGEATAALAELGAVATGVDARPGALETARELRAPGGLLRAQRLERDCGVSRTHGRFVPFGRREQEMDDQQTAVRAMRAHEIPSLRPTGLCVRAAACWRSARARLPRRALGTPGASPDR